MTQTLVQRFIQEHKRPQASDGGGIDLLVLLARKNDSPSDEDLELLAGELERRGLSIDHFDKLVKAREQFKRHRKEWDGRGQYEQRLQELDAANAKFYERAKSPRTAMSGGERDQVAAHLRHCNSGWELQGILRQRFGAALFDDLEADYACPEPEPVKSQHVPMTCKSNEIYAREREHRLRMMEQADAEAGWSETREREASTP